MEVDKISDFVWEIKKDEKLGMNVPVHIYTNSALVKFIQRDRTLSQAMNAATLPSIVKHMLVMPDGHEGYGFPVGGVAAFDADDGIVSPGICGFDINCGIRLIKTNMTEKDVKPKIPQLLDALFKNVPSGVGSRIQLGFTKDDLENIVSEGAPYVIDKGYGFKGDAERTEENGCIEGADSEKVSALAKKRGFHEVGTLGAGNHFLEVQKVGKIIDERLAKAFGLYQDQVVVMVHSGSRGYGHQVCSDYLELLSEYQRS